jgi:phenylalanyl-tRNA synthetase beta subunit
MIFEIFLTVILNHALNSFHGSFQDLTLWMNRDAEPSSA